MRHVALATTSLLVVLSTGFGTTPSKSADLVWQVENPFRFFKRSASFDAARKSLRRGARRRERAVARQDHLEDRTAPQRSGLQGLHDPAGLRQHGARPLRDQPAGLGGADGRLHVLRPQCPAAPLHDDLRPAVFLGHREGRLCASRGPYGRSCRSRRKCSLEFRPATAPGSGRRAGPASRARPASRPARTSSSSSACRIRTTATRRAPPSR